MPAAAVAGMTRSDRVIVIGGGIGGLLTAHALARQGLDVTVLERGRYDPLPGDGAPPARAGVPQSHCLHMLMTGGAAVFDAVVPGWRDRLAAAGAVPFDAMADAAMRFAGGWIARVPSGLTMYAC
jgi:2-polyprenyl-6-methoxyphenol hydroxylase-like FAD-dependent oxidoreductase